MIPAFNVILTYGLYDKRNLFLNKPDVFKLYI